MNRDTEYLEESDLGDGSVNSHCRWCPQLLPGLALVFTNVTSFGLILPPIF